jgi:uncharacterized membrane protein YdjX (TVP38/TMEM64 family)
MSRFKILLLAGLLLLFSLIVATGGGPLLDPTWYQAAWATHPAKLWLVFFGVYVLMSALSIPGATPMTLVAGALMGFGPGLLLVSFASSLGATLAFLLARTLFREQVQQRFSGPVNRINQGVAKEGLFYLFSLRLIPMVPFFVINLAMGLTRMKVWPFYLVSQAGMLPGTAVYVNAGTQLANIDTLSVRGIMTPQLLSAFVLLALFPWLARWAISLIRRSNHG